MIELLKEMDDAIIIGKFYLIEFTPLRKLRIVKIISLHYDNFSAHTYFDDGKSYFHKLEFKNHTFIKEIEIRPESKALCKYERLIKPGVHVDVYDVLMAFDIKCPAMAHAVKKCLAAGQRGAKSSIQDKEEAIKSIQRSIELERSK